jgi:hypothetical protein
MATACGDVASPFRLVHAFARNAGLADAALSDLDAVRPRAAIGRWALAGQNWTFDANAWIVDNFRPVAAVCLRVQRAIQTADAHQTTDVRTGMGAK